MIPESQLNLNISSNLLKNLRTSIKYYKFIRFGWIRKIYYFNKY